MIFTNTVSMFIFHHHQSGICNKNIRSIQEIMHMNKPDNEKYKKVCKYLPNIAIVTKSSTLGEVQLAFAHTSVGNTPLGESVTAFALAGSLDSPSVVLIDVNIAFSMDGDNIRLQISEVLLRTAAGDLASSNKQRYWTPINAILIPPLLMEAQILCRETSTEYLLKTFTCTITERSTGE